MNHNIIPMIKLFCKESKNFNHNGNLQAKILQLDFLTDEWIRNGSIDDVDDVDNVNGMNERVGQQMEKIIFELVEKISGQFYPPDYIYIFSELIIAYTNELSRCGRNMDELSKLFGGVKMDENLGMDIADMMDI